MRNSRHAIRIAVIWVIVTVIAELLISIAPIPSPSGSQEAMGEHETLYLLFYIAVPFFIFVWVFFLYSLVTFRLKPGESGDGAPIRDSTPVLLIWAAISFITVLFLAGWGTFTLHEITSPPDPAGASASSPFVIQVIGQQWFWTYRYPSYGGMETRTLVLPVDTPIRFDITSLDVTHSFWIYDYDIKEDAVPGVKTSAYMLAKRMGSSTANGTDWVVCNELCGLWHGYMRNKMRIISKPAFATWAATTEHHQKAIGFLSNLPKYSNTYIPQPAAFSPPPQDQSP